MDPEFLETAYTLRNKYFPQNTSDLTAEPSVYNSKKIRGKCEICHKDMASETHHLSPQRNADPNGFIQEDSGRFHKNHPGNLASVCEECHKKTHSTKKTHCSKKNYHRVYFMRTKQITDSFIYNCHNIYYDNNRNRD